MAQHKPRILILGSIDAATVPPLFLAGEVRAEQTVRSALEARGCEVRFVDVAVRPTPAVAELVGEASAVMVLGGADVDPSLYGLPADHPKALGVNRSADDFTIAVLHAAVERRIPLLCICRGAQILNVARGGTLIPDIEDWAIHHGPKAETIFVTEKIRLDPDSRLARLLGETGVAVQNGHHQAIDAVGTGLVATAWAADGIVEAIEFPQDSAVWAVGVQWHPEHKDADPVAFNLLMDEFAKQLTPPIAT